MRPVLYLATALLLLATGCAQRLGVAGRRNYYRTNPYTLPGHQLRTGTLIDPPK